MTPSLNFETTILRHCVTSGADGLSPLQRRMIESEKKVRVFSAPTGGGKSYAFQRAVMERPDTRVLFIVPTRRLAQNLAASLAEGLVASGAAKDREAAASMAALWTSDERARQEKERPDLKVGRLRVQELRGWDEGRERRMIFATPESVAWLLFRPDRSHHGATPVNVEDFLAGFDHIVFDEFHTIDARGFGLAALLSKIASGVTGGARITFLSATPIDLGKVLDAVGVAKDAIETAAEEVITGAKAETGGARALHGDVVLSFEDADTLADLFERHLDRIGEAVASGGQVVAIFDSLAALHGSKGRIAALLDRIGIPLARRLAVNSADDRATGFDGLFTSGAAEDPTRFAVVLATSSVEIGVTLRATLMLMDPGYGPASFAQRVGRAARGDVAGRVIVRVDAASIVGRYSWTGLIRDKLRVLSKSAITVDEFLAAALFASRRAFEPAGDFTTEAIPSTFASMPQRAVWCAALFSVALEHAWHLRKGQKQTLRDFAPPQAAVVGAKLAAIRTCGIHSAKVWAAAFEAEALRLRFILPPVIVVEPGGRRSPISQTVYTGHAAFSEALETFETDAKTGATVLVARIDRPLHMVLGTSEKTRPDRSFEALLPHVSGPVRVGLSDDPVEEWLRHARKELEKTRVEPAQKIALEAAIALVSMSRIAPTPAARDAAPPSGVSASGIA